MLRPSTSLRNRPKFVDSSNPGPGAHAIVSPTVAKKAEPKKARSLEDFIDSRDYQGAVTFLKFEKGSGQSRIAHLDAWLAYAYVHSGDFEEACKIYNEMLLADPTNADFLVNKAICLYGMANFNEALQVAQTAQCNSNLKNRLIMHLASKVGDEQLMMYHMKMLDQGDPADQMSIAGLHFLRSNWSEAHRMYKMLVESDEKKYAALYVYMAMCQYSLEYFEIANQYLNAYTEQTNKRMDAGSRASRDPYAVDSIIVANLYGCITNMTYNGQTADQELKKRLVSHNFDQIVKSHDILRHNKHVFSEGAGAALNDWKDLVAVLPEAKWNVCIHHLRAERWLEAYQTLQTIDGTYFVLDK